MFGLILGVAGGIVLGAFTLRGLAWLAEPRGIKMVSLDPAVRARREWWRRSRRIAARLMIGVVAVYAASSLFNQSGGSWLVALLYAAGAWGLWPVFKP